MSNRYWRILCLVNVILACSVHAVHVYAKGSRLHHETTQFAEKHDEKEPTWKEVTPLRTERAFYDAVGREALCLVFFYAKWSRASLELARDIEAAAIDLTKTTRPAVPIFAVNLEVLPNLGREYRVNHFPSFAVFRMGSLAPNAEQQVPRYGPAIAGYMKTLLRDAVDTLSTLEAAVKYVDPKTKLPVCKAKIGLIRSPVPHPDDHVEKTVILCFSQDNEIIANVHDTSRLLANFFALYLVSSDKVRKAYDAADNSCVVYRRWGDKSPVTYNLQPHPELNLRIIKWLVYNAIQPMRVFDEESKPIFNMRHKPLLIYFSHSRLAESDPLHQLLCRIGMDDELNVTVTQSNPNHAGKHVAHFLGMDDALRDQGYAIGMLVGRKKYRLESSVGAPTEAIFREFIRACVNESHPEYHKSEPHSNIYPAGRVSELAYVDFEKTIIDDKAHDAVILMYNPDDQHSSHIMPILDELAISLKGTDILVARMNVIANDYHDQYVIPGTPSILYAKRTNKTAPIRMNGVARTLENIQAFITQHAAVSLSALSPSNQTPSASPHGVPQVPGPDEL